MEFTYFIFLNSSGQTLFVRSDIEDGHFVHQEMTLTATFPFNPAKRIERGQRIAFRSVADNAIKVLEIRNVEERESDHGQVITAEHICIAELSDEHINKTEITNKTASEALATALSGTLWGVGTNTASGTQNADFSRGSVWDAVNTIKQNWNVYIEPRVVISAAGVITGRYLDISPAQGTFRGLRLSVRKNMTDPCVTYNDDEVLTALYGYGGTVDKAQASGDDTQEELTFASVVWTATSDHPAKPLNQTFLEWPEKTALYGRNGRARFGYYQNGSITDPAVLLEKTWEALKKTCDPKVTIQGGVIDLYRLGYKGQPIRLHDIAIIEIEETGTLLNKEIICFDEDLVNPDGDRVEIGDYIPNIIYINRETAKNARGGGGSGGRGQTNAEDEETRYYTDFFNLGTKVGMIVRTKNGVDYIDAPQISLAINDWNDPTSRILLKADAIDVDGLVEALKAKSLEVATIEATGAISADTIDIANNADVGSLTSNTTIKANGEVDAGSLKVGGDGASWQTYTARYCGLSTARYFMYASGSGGTTPAGTAHGQLVTSHDDTVIHYLGY